MLDALLDVFDSLKLSFFSDVKRILGLFFGQPPSTSKASSYCVTLVLLLNNWLKSKGIRLQIWLEGLRGGWAARGACWQAWRSEFDPQDSHGGRTHSQILSSDLCAHTELGIEKDRQTNLRISVRAAIMDHWHNTNRNHACLCVRLGWG